MFTRFRTITCIVTQAPPTTTSPPTVTTSVGDPNWGLVILSLPFESDLIDLKYNLPTVSQNVIINSVEKCAEFRSGVNAYLTYTYVPAKFDWWTSDFTLECWINIAEYSVFINDWAKVPCLIGNMETLSSNNCWSFGPNTDGKLAFYYWNGAKNLAVSDKVISLNRWTHIAVTKSNVGITLFVDGNPSPTVSINGTPTGVTSLPLTIGKYSNVNFIGKIKDLKITRKVKYAVSFTPNNLLSSTQTLDYDPLYSNSALVLDSQSQSIDRTFEDSSGNSQLMLPLTYDPLLGQGLISPASIDRLCAYFDGSDDRLSSTIQAQKDAVTFGTSDFTIDFWANFEALDGTPGIVGFKRMDSVTGWVVYRNSTNNKIGIRVSTPDLDLFSTSDIVINKWTHYAFVRKSGILKVYVNGVLENSVSSPHNMTVDSTTIFYIGMSQTWGGYFKGCLHNLRVIKNYAAYTSNFTPRITSLTDSVGSGTLAYYGLVDANINRNYALNLDLTVSGSPVSRVNVPSLEKGSIYFPGTCRIYTQSPNLSFGSEDFCFETWYYPIAKVTSNPSLLFFGPSWSAGAIIINDRSASYPNVIVFGAYNFSGGNLVVGTTPITNNNWYHIAITKSGSTYRLYINGKLDASNVWSGSLSDGLPKALSIGGFSTDNWIKGHLTNTRLIKGRAVYTQDFVPSVDLEKTDDTVLLLKANNNGFSNRPNVPAIDNTGNHSLQINGNTYPGLLSPYSADTSINPGSLYFDGYTVASDIRTPASSSFDFGSGNFTIEFWYNIQDLNLNKGKIFVYVNESDTSYAAINIYLDGSGRLSGEVCTVPTSVLTITDPNVSPINQWIHVALVRNGTVFTLYKNGIYVNAVSSSAALKSKCSLSVGTNNATNYSITGYISDLRVIKNQSLYTQSFTPSDTPLATIPNTVFHLKATPLIQDQKSLTNIKTYGNPLVLNYLNTNQPVYWFNNNGDYLKLSNIKNYDLTGDFTIETWLYVSSYASIVLIDLATSNTSARYSINLRTDGQLQMYANSALQYSGALVPLNSWTHIAMVRTGGYHAFYINGSLASAPVSMTNSFICTQALIGTNWPIDKPGVSGFYLKDFRISKVARYTSNFTPSLNPENKPFTTSLSSFTPAFELVCTPSIQDSKGKTITTIGSVQVKTDNPVSIADYPSVLYFDGINSRLELADSPDFALNSDFTLEAFVNLDRQTGVQTIYEQRNVSYNSLQLSEGKLRFVTASLGVQSPIVLAPYTWYHVACTFSLNRLSLYVNGRLVSTSATAAFSDISASLSIGASSDGTNAFKGHLCGLMLTRACKYSEDFRSKFKLTDMFKLSKTPTLYLSDGPLGQHIIDAAGHPITNQNNLVSYSQVVPPNSSYLTSLYFNGNTRLELADSSDWILGANYTIEAWINLENVTNINAIYYHRHETFAQFNILYVKDGKLYYAIMDNGNYHEVVSGALLTNNTWTHVAVCCVENKPSLFINGWKAATYSGVMPSIDVSNILCIGSANDNTNRLKGYICHLLVVKEAKYAHSFVPQLKLLDMSQKEDVEYDPYWNQMVLSLPLSSDILDYKGNAVTAYGNAGLSSTSSKFGTHSLYLDGAGDYLTVPNTNLKFGTSDFTIETWVNPSARVSLYPTLFANDATWGAGGLEISLGHNSFDINKYQVHVYGASPAIQSISNIQYNAWTHLALVRYSGVIHLFVNGVLEGSYACTADLSGVGSLFLVGVTGNKVAESYFKGYVQDFRVTKGIARYIRDFVPPSQLSTISTC